MDLTRREIYKAFTQNARYDQVLTEEIEQKMQREFNILNPPLHNSE